MHNVHCTFIRSEGRVYSASCVLIMHPYCLSLTEVKTAKAHENRMQGVVGMGLEEEEWHVTWVQLVILLCLTEYFNCSTLYIKKML